MATITLKNIPKQLHQMMKQRAVRHHRSMNSEVIACLNQAVGSAQVDPESLIARARALRRKLSVRLSEKDLSALKGEGRP
ncbi:MAG: Arc family DNA-binding protein [Proteobacteria bacterium]|nr:Arc family DNA-binding protein [Pseudomonadota bacterium]